MNKPPNVPDRVPMGRETKRLRRKMSPTEHVAVSQKLAQAIREHDRLVALHRQARREMTDREKGSEGAIRILATDVRDGETEADVACRWVVNFAAGRTALVRLDTGVSVFDRPISDDDRQLALEHSMDDPDWQAYLDRVIAEGLPQPGSPIDPPKSSESDADDDPPEPT